VGGAVIPRSPVLVWGAGAMGGTLGAHLVREGFPVFFVDRDPEHVEAMNRSGLRITGPVAEFTVPAQAVLPGDLQGHYSTVFLCVKAHHTREAVAEVARHLERQGAVISIQNGLNEMVIEEVVGPARTVGAFVNFGADCLEPGVIHWGGRGAVVVGELDGRLTLRVKAIHRMLTFLEPRAVVTDNIFGYLWGKLAYAALLFATALTDAPIAEVLARERFRPLLVALAREVVAVAEARGVRLEGFDGFDPGAFGPGAAPEAATRSLDDLVAFNRRSAKTHSGIWRDLAVRHRPTEVDAQLGIVVELGREVGVPTPLLERLVHLIHEIEWGKRSQGWETLEELRYARLEWERGDPDLLDGL